MLAQKRRALRRTLSGGQRQILAMAMALMTQPELLLLDEPTAGLSPMAAERLFEAIVALNRGGLPILMVEQNASRRWQSPRAATCWSPAATAARALAAALAADPEIRRLFLGG